MSYFFVQDFSGDIVTLNEEESRHGIRVLRLKTGEPVFLVDGKGGFYEAVILDPDPRECKVRIINTIREYNKRNYHLHIGIAPTKNHERFEWFLEKATEIGVDEITPLICQRSERDSIKMERSLKIMVSAIKQSRKAFLPILSKETLFLDFVKSNAIRENYIAHCQSDNLTLFYRSNNLKNVCILIGPEGDFSTEEIQLAKKYGYAETSLGNTIYRTETAGIIACHTVYLHNQK